MFVTPRADEDVIHETPRHWWVLVRHAVIPGTLLVATIVISTAISLARPAWLPLPPILILPALIAIPTVAILWLLWAYIDWLDDGLAVAIGGNGSAAKSSDEIGRLAASLFTADGWTGSLSQDVFAPRLV